MTEPSSASRSDDASLYDAAKDLHDFLWMNVPNLIEVSTSSEMAGEGLTKRLMALKDTLKDRPMNARSFTKKERAALREAAGHSLSGAYEGDPEVLESAIHKLQTLPPCIKCLDYRERIANMEARQTLNNQTASRAVEEVVELRQKLATAVSEQQPITDNDRRWRFLEHGCQWVSFIPINGEQRSFDPRILSGYAGHLQDMRATVDAESAKHIKMLKEAIEQSRPAERYIDG